MSMPIACGFKCVEIRAQPYEVKNFIKNFGNYSAMHKRYRWDK